MSERELSTPAELTARAGCIAADHADAGLVDDRGALNVVVAGELNPDATALTDGGYDGPTAPTAAHLAAVASVLTGEDGRACLHYPEPTATAAGPWLVLEPLAGRVSTVHVGRGRLTLELARDASLPDTVRGLLDAAEPNHEHYPVATDDLGVFATGVETADLRTVDSDGGRDGSARVTFDVSVTPSTTAAGVESRYASVGGVATASFEVVTGLERASPPAALRDAVERAHVAVRGDCEYEWRPEPSVFSHLPTGRKIAFGTAPPGAARVEASTSESCADLLARILDGWSESGAKDRSGATEGSR